MTQWIKNMLSRAGIDSALQTTHNARSAPPLP